MFFIITIFKNADKIKKRMQPTCSNSSGGSLGDKDANCLSFHPPVVASLSSVDPTGVHRARDPIYIVHEKSEGTNRR